MKTKKVSTTVRRFMLVFVLIVVVVTEVMNLQLLSTTVIGNYGELVKSSSSANADLINTWLEGQGDLVNSIATDLEGQPDLSRSQIEDYLASQLENNDSALMYYLTFGDTKDVILADGSTIDLDPNERSWYIAATETGELCFTEPYVDARTGGMVVSVSKMLTFDNRVAVVLADISLDKLVEIVSAVTTNDGMEAFLMGADGSIITHNNTDFLPTEDSTTLYTDVVNIDISSTDTVKTKDYDGDLKLFSFTTIESTGWIVATDMDLSYVNGVIQSKVMGILVIIIVFLVVALLVETALLRKLLNPISAVTSYIAKVAQGDFSDQIESVNRKDDIGVLYNSVASLIDIMNRLISQVNYILGSMCNYDLSIEDMDQYPGDYNQLSESVNQIKKMMYEMVYQIQVSSSEVEAGSNQLADAAQALSDGTTSQASSVINLESDVEHVSDMVDQNAENCTTVNTQLMDLEKQIQQGNTEMENLYQVVGEIEQMSNDIQAIVSAIDNIAFQTNILALNASVEAARAGEHGKGFAVVANEVGSLANKSSQQSKETADLIEACISAINKAKSYADTTKECLNQVVSNSTVIAGAFNTIADSTNEQAENTRNIKSELGNISDVVQTNIATAQETAASSEELSGQALNLKNMVARFKM